MKLTEKTPIDLRCGVGPCPAVFEDQKGNLIIIGRRLTDQEINTHLAGRVNADETVIEIPATFFADLIAKK